MNERIKILDIWVDPVDRLQAIERVRFFLNGHRLCSIFAANPEKNFSVPKDPILYDVFRNADLLIPDGIGMVLAARVLYGVRFSRVPGVELMNDICLLASKVGKSVFFYGANEAVNEKSVIIMKQRYPMLKIAGRSNGYVPEPQMSDLVKKINDSGAEILFLALGSPKQERWFATYRSDLVNVKICQGIGGTLDTIAGTVKRAPAVWQRLSLEWLYRLLSEPRRIQRQKFLPLFALKILRMKMHA